VHKLAVEVQVPDEEGDKYSSSVHIPYKYGSKANAEGDTWEQALEEGLVNALKLIEL
jgi:hypothetical protein